MQIPDFLSVSMDEDHELDVISPNIIGVSTNIEELEDSLGKKSGKIILISGLSGAGKDSVLDSIHEKIPQTQRVKTCTTRERRPGESEVDDPYIRLSLDEIKEKIRSGDAMEYVEYAGNYYCTSQSVLSEVIEENRIPLMRVDPVGARVFLDKWRREEGLFANVSLYYFFIVPESYEDLRQRLVHRGEDSTTIEKRIEQSRMDAAYIKDAQFVAINRKDKLDKVVDEIVSVLNKD